MNSMSIEKFATLDSTAEYNGVLQPPHKSIAPHNQSDAGHANAQLQRRLLVQYISARHNREGAYLVSW